MLKGKLDTSTKGKDTIGCVVDLNITKNRRNATKIIERKIVQYFNNQTKQIIYEDKKVTLNIILSDLLVKDI